jgi:hypothetical protein
MQLSFSGKGEDLKKLFLHERQYWLLRLSNCLSHCISLEAGGKHKEVKALGGSVIKLKVNYKQTEILILIENSYTCYHVDEIKRFDPQGPSLQNGIGGACGHCQGISYDPYRNS